jgi:hypothetical protein
MTWQARRDSNPQHPVLETGALAVRATGLYSFFISLPYEVCDAGTTDNIFFVRAYPACFSYFLSCCNCVFCIHCTAFE